MTRFALPLALSAAAVASAFTPTTLHVHVAAPRSALLRMFEMPEKEAPDEVVIKSVTRSREAGMDRVSCLHAPEAARRCMRAVALYAQVRLVRVCSPLPLTLW